jgi:uncharacterized protein YchJ
LCNIEAYKQDELGRFFAKINGKWYWIDTETVQKLNDEAFDSYEECKDSAH